MFYFFLACMLHVSLCGLYVFTHAWAYMPTYVNHVYVGLILMSGVFLAHSVFFKSC